MKPRLPLSLSALDNRFPVYFASLAGCIATSSSLHGLDYTWSGATSNVSTLPANWSVSGLPATAAPGVADNVLINLSTINPTSIPTGNWDRRGAGTTTISGTGIVNLTTGSARFLNAGPFDLSGGQFNHTGEYFIVANPANGATTGTFTHSGGTLTSTHTRGFFIGDGAAALGSSYFLAGGTMNVISTATGSTSAGDRRLRSVWLGKAGESTAAPGVTGDLFKITSGTATFTKTHATATADLLLSRNSKIELEGGTVTFDKYNEVRIGHGYAGTDNSGTTPTGANNSSITLSGGTLNITGGSNVRVGYADAGHIQMSGGALNLTGNLNVGTGGATGTVTMTGGTLTVTNAATNVIGGGNNGNATVSLSGNSILNAATTKWKTGDFGGTGNAGTTSITLSDNAALTLKEFTIGHIGSAAASDIVTLGGSSALTVNNFITIGRDDNATQSGIVSSLNLNGGTLATQYIVKGGDTSTATKNLVNANGGTIKALADQADFFKQGTLNPGRVYLNVEAGGLVFDTNGFNVGIQNAINGSGGLTKTGTGTLTLSGATPNLGATHVNAGTLEVSTGNPLPGPVTVAADATLTVGGSASLQWNSADLNLAGGSSVSITNLDPQGTFSPAIRATNSLVPTGTVSLNVTGTFGVGDFPLIGYPTGGSIGGDGLAAFQLVPLPRGIVADLVDAGEAVTLRVSAINALTWKGNASTAWDINTTTNWTLGGTPDNYFDGDAVLFDDSATGGTDVNVLLDTTVTPRSVTFNNSGRNYILSGSGSIGGTTPIVKSNPGTATLLTANTSTGTTTVESGTLQLGNGTSNGSVNGALINYDTVIFHPADTATLANSLEGPGTFIKTGFGSLISTAPSITANGTFQVNEGTLQFGDGTSNGVVGSLQFEIAAGATLRLNQATATPLPASVGGAGDLVVSPAQSIQSGNLALNEDFTGTLRVENGRVDARSGEIALGNAAKVEVLSGAQLLAFGSIDPYTTPVEIAGNGAGEAGFPGGLRLAGGATATWDGSVTLTAASGLMVQRGATFTVTGAITGDYPCEFFAADSATDFGTLIVAPGIPSQNSYASTRITGSAKGSIVAGNEHAFSPGPLLVDNAILKLNGNSFTFANLSGTGGAVGNYHPTTPATLTVGSDHSSTSYTGVIRDGDSAPLSLVKTGTGTLTLAFPPAYTGDTTVSEGMLTLANSGLADNSTVTIGSGAVLEIIAATSDTVGALVLGNSSVGPGTYNSSHPVYGAYFAGAGSLVIAGAGFDSWAASRGLDGTPGKENGLADDPDRDGIANLTEFYLDGNPLANDPSILPAGSLDDDYLTLTFSRRDDAEADVTAQAIQYGTSLAGWIDATLGATTSTDANGVIVTVEENDDASDAITVRIPRALAIDGRMFGRLQIIK